MKAKTWTTPDVHPHSSQQTTVTGPTIEDAIETAWSSNILPYIPGNSAGSVVDSVTLYPPIVGRTRANKPFARLRIVSHGSPHIVPDHLKSKPADIVMTIDFFGPMDDIAYHEFEI